LERRWIAPNHLDVAASLSYATSLFDVTKKDRNAGAGRVLRHEPCATTIVGRLPIDALPCSTSAVSIRFIRGEEDAMGEGGGDTIDRPRQTSTFVLVFSLIYLTNTCPIVIFIIYIYTVD
jgi:hypothetical protein